MGETNLIDTLLWLVAVIGTSGIALVTLLPFSSSYAWWVRMWDFPRVQIAVASAAAVPLLCALNGLAKWPMVAVAAACLGYQCWRILPYTPLFQKEMRLAPQSAGEQVTLLAVNVLQDNRDHRSLLALIDEVKPHVLLLMETHERWLKALEPALARYQTVLREPRDNYYGIVFATSLPAIEVRIAYLTPDDTPSVFAELTAPNGRSFRFVGLHPQPPVPGVDTKERDDQILFAARFARKTGSPLIAMGDFNEAAWSDTSQSFKTLGRYVDPRVGRGLYASFDANSWLLRCPIDQFYSTQDVAMVSLRLGPHIGSDHFPVIAQVRIDPELAKPLNVSVVETVGKDDAELDARAAEYQKRLDAALRDRKVK